MKDSSFRSITKLDTFTHRQAIFRSLVDHLHLFNGNVLDVGCGTMPYRATVLRPPSRARSYIGLDLPDHELYTVYPDLTWDGSFIPLASESIDSVMCTEVLEHIPEPIQVLKEIFRVLKVGGFLFLTVPFLWPLHDVPYDEYRYTPFALARLLEASGFTQVSLKSLGGWDASLAQLIGLWVRRRPMPPVARSGLSIALLPLVYVMSRKDETTSNFNESLMITGLAGTAFKT